MSRATSRTVALLLAASTMAACQWHAVPRTEASLGNDVSQAELTASGATTLYDALQRTRGRYFTSRGISSISSAPRDAILVFRGGAIMGTDEVLRVLRPSDVRKVHHLSAVETYHKYGQVVSVGGLEVELVSESALR